MQYSVKITPSAIGQIQETVAYISKVLLSPQTAIAWSNYLQKEIASLDNMPAKFPLVDIEPWKTNGIHKMDVKNFIVYYLIDESKKTVWVTAVIYGKRDQISSLKNMPY